MPEKSDDDRPRDPVEIIAHARQYLRATRGVKFADASQAMGILAEAEIKAAKCIDHLIGAAWRARGIRCPCDFHQKEVQAELKLEPPQAARRLSGKERAAGEKSDD